MISFHALQVRCEITCHLVFAASGMTSGPVGMEMPQVAFTSLQLLRMGSIGTGRNTGNGLVWVRFSAQNCIL